jgi:hypothetical protein
MWSVTGRVARVIHEAFRPIDLVAQRLDALGLGSVPGA